jgi:hypothetical protein
MINRRRTRPAKPKITRTCEREGCTRLVTSGNICTACRVAKCRGLGPDRACRICGIVHPRMLRTHSFRDEVVVLCANHSALAGRQPITFAEFEGQALMHDPFGMAKKSA